MTEQGLNVRDELHRIVRHFPDHEALVGDEFRYTYRDMQQRVRQMAALLHGLGVRKGDRVAMMLLPSTIHPVVLYGIWELGAVSVALHARESAGVLEKTLVRVSPRVLVYDGVFDETVAKLRQRVPFVTGYVRARCEGTPADKVQPVTGEPLIPDDLDRYSMDFEPMAIHGFDLASIVLTSGSTGVPKGVMHRHWRLVESCRAAVYPFGLTPHSCTVNMFTTSFMGWKNLALPYFNVGAKQVFMHHFDPVGILERMQRERATSMLLVPTMWRILLRQDVEAYDLSSLKVVGFAGEVMDVPTLEQIRKRICPRVLNCYSTTETAVSGGTVMFPEDLERPEKIQSVGRPLLNSEVRIIEIGGTAQDEVPRGQEGEIIIRAPSVAQEMWNDPPLTREKFEGTWWHSGDLGRFDDEGFLYVQGRIDDMIITGGINVLPAPVEETLLGHPNISEAAVVGLPDPEWGQRITAFIVAQAPGLLTAEALDEYVQETSLSHYQRPRQYVFLDEMPKGNSGKTNRRALRDGYAGN